METVTTYSQVATTITTARSNKKYPAMFKKSAMSALAIAGVLGAAAVASQRSNADVQADPAAAFSFPQRAVAAQVLRDYPMPGDPHDAEASFNELYGALAGAIGFGALEDEPAERVSQVKSWKIDISRLSPATRILRQYPMPGDPHDAEASFNELYEVEARGLKVSAAPVEPATQRPPLVPAVVVPRPGDPHDDQFSQ